MRTIHQLPILGLALGAALLIGAGAAHAEGDQVDTQSQTGTQIDDTLGTETQMQSDAAVLQEIEDDSVMHDGLTVGEIEGTDVYVGENDIGEIEEVLGDESGQVQAFILSVEDGVFDLDATRIVVPAEEFTFDAENDRFHTQLTEADLEGYETWAE